jgi:hypothetical protein
LVTLTLTKSTPTGFMAVTVAVLRERCACGAEIETDERNAIDLVRDWRDSHACPDKPDDDYQPIGGVAQVEQAPDYTIPELHVGFRL